MFNRPRAVVGAQQAIGIAPWAVLQSPAMKHQVVTLDTPDGPVERTVVKYYEPSETNRINGYRLWFRIRVEGVTPAEAWRGVFPGSTSSDSSARVQAQRLLKFYEEEYPPTFAQVANALGLSPYVLLANLKDALEATIWEWDDKLKKRSIPGAQTAGLV